MRHGLDLHRRGQLVWLLALVALLTGSGAAAAPLHPARAVGAAATTAAVSGTFVGKVEGAPIGIVVVAEKPTAEGQARRISMYVCNGTSLSAWLTADSPANSVPLRSADHMFNARVTLTAFTASGVLVLPTGRQFGFKVRRAVDIAGLFDVTIASTGLVQGKSSTGATLTGHLGSTGTLPRDGTVVATASAGGQDVKLTALARNVTPGTYRWIVLTDRNVYGANTRGPDLGGIGGFLRPTGGTQTRIKAGGAGQKGYDDRKCGRLANQFNNLNKQFEGGITSGKQTTATKAAGTKAQKILDELDDHCVVIF
jgi:hypothetical protein